MLKKLIFIATLLYTSALALVCLIRLNNLPDVGVSFGDKIFHFLAYALLMLLWFSTFLYNVKLKPNKAIISAFLFSVIFGIIIEVLQGTVTDFRSLDVYDVVANTLGALLTAVTLWLKKTLHVKNH